MGDRPPKTRAVADLSVIDLLAPYGASKTSTISSLIEGREGRLGVKM
jgi:hypothetical protein